MDVKYKNVYNFRASLNRILICFTIQRLNFAAFHIVDSWQLSRLSKFTKGDVGNFLCCPYSSRNV